MFVVLAAGGRGGCRSGTRKGEEPVVKADECHVVVGGVCDTEG